MEQRSAFDGMRNACVSAGKSIPSGLHFGLGHTESPRVCTRGREARHPENALPAKLLW